MTHYEKAGKMRKFGLDLVGDVPWGTHLCQFYETKQDLIDILVPYFRAGLENNEFCMWITAEPLNEEDAKKGMEKSMPRFSEYLKRGQIEILSYKDWYVKGGVFDADRVLQGWTSKLEAALKKGYSGLRLTGNTFWLEKKDWRAFTDYEEAVNRVIGRYKMIAVCTYCLDKCNAHEIIDVIKNHQFALIKRRGKWELIESAEKKRIADDLIKTEEKFTALFNSMIEGVALHDVVYDDSGKAVDYVLADVNSAFEKITGLSKKQTIGKKASELYGTGSPPYLDVYAEVASSGKSASFETYFPPMQKHFSISVFSPSKGKFNTVFYDITERKKAEEVMLKNEERLNRSQEISHLGSWELDLTSNCLTWSDEVYRIFGLKPQEFGATYEAFLDAVHPDDRAAVDNAYSSSLRERRDTYEIEHRVVRKSTGEIRIVYEKCNHIRDEAGRIIRSIGMVQDITGRKEMEKKLELYANHLERLVEEKTKQLRDAERLAAIGETAGMVGHDIRNPLQAIIYELYLAKDELASLPDGDPKKSLKGTVRAIEDQVTYINKIVTDLQDYAKPLAPCFEETDLEKTLQSVLSTIYIPETIKVSSRVDDDCPKLITDNSYVTRILTNLVSNAVQAMPNGGKLSITLQCKDNKVFLNVEDTGEGIKEEAKSKLFKPLFTTKAKGQGFGLAVVKKLTEALNGTIKFESIVGKGTKFTIEFPYSSVKAKATKK